MQTEFRKDLKTRCLVITPYEKTLDTEDYTVGMITQNKMPGFAKCSKEQMNGNTLLYYDISEKVQLSSYLEMFQADKELYNMLFPALSEAMESVSEYLLKPDGILLDPQYVFIEIEDKKISFVYYPYNEKGFDEGCKILSEKLLEHIKHDDMDTVRIGYEFHKSCMIGSVTSETFRNMAHRKIANSTSQTNHPQEENQPALKKEKENIKLTACYDNDKDKEKKHSVFYSFKEHENEKKATGGIINKIFKVKEKGKKFGTGPSRQIKAYLLPEKGLSGENIELVKDNYFVGKQSAGADIAFASKAVSRAQAKLFWEQDKYTLADLCSKNGTKVNGVKLKEGEKITLHDGDRIVFADTPCIYKQSAII